MTQSNAQVPLIEDVSLNRQPRHQILSGSGDNVSPQGNNNFDSNIMTGTSVPGFWSNSFSSTTTTMTGSSVPNWHGLLTQVSGTSPRLSGTSPLRTQTSIANSPSVSSKHKILKTSIPHPLTPQVSSLSTSLKDVSNSSRESSEKEEKKTPSGSSVTSPEVGRNNTDITSRNRSKTFAASTYKSDEFRSQLLQKSKQPQTPHTATQSEFSAIVGNLLPGTSSNVVSNTNSPSLSHICLHLSRPKQTVIEQLSPDDFIPFMRKPLFLIVDSDASSSFISSGEYVHFNNAVRLCRYGQPVVVLMSPTQPRFVSCSVFRSISSRSFSSTNVLSSSLGTASTTPIIPHLVPLLPHHSAIGRIYTLALSDPLSAMLILAHPAHSFRAALLRTQSLPGGACFPYHPSSLTSRNSLVFSSNKINNNTDIQSGCSCYSLSPCSPNCPCLISTSHTSGSSPSSPCCSYSSTDSVVPSVIPFLFSDFDSPNSSAPSFMTLVRCRELLERTIALLSRLYMHAHLHPPLEKSLYDFYENSSWNSSSPGPSPSPSCGSMNPIDSSFLRLCEDPFLRQFVMRHCFFNALLHMHIAYVGAPEECFPSTNPPLPQWLLKHRAWEYCIVEMAKELDVGYIFTTKTY
jgi:hypothetical protein